MLVQMKIFNEMLDKMIKYEDSTLSATYILDLVDEINEMTIKLQLRQLGGFIIHGKVCKKTI